MSNVFIAQSDRAVTVNEIEQTFGGQPGVPIFVDVRFDVESYDRYVVVSAFGSAPFEGNAGAHGGHGEFGGVIVERIENGTRKMANQSVEANASSITFFASITEGFFIPRNTNRQLTYSLQLQGATNRFGPASLSVKHATLNLS